MMKSLEKGQDKLQKICEVLKTETLEPAKREAENLIQEAKEKAKKIINEAEKQAQKIQESVHQRMNQERSAFHSSLEQASKQALESLRQEIELNFFNEGLEELVIKYSSEPKAVAKLISALVTSLEREGLESDLTAIIPKSIPAKSVVAELSEGVLKQLKGRTVEIGSFSGGAKVRLTNNKITFDISDAALKELLSQYVRKDFREAFFKN